MDVPKRFVKLPPSSLCKPVCPRHPPQFPRGPQLPLCPSTPDPATFFSIEVDSLQVGLSIRTLRAVRSASMTTLRHEIQEVARRRRKIPQKQEMLEPQRKACPQGARPRFKIFSIWHFPYLLYVIYCNVILSMHAMQLFLGDMIKSQHRSESIRNFEWCLGLLSDLIKCYTIGDFNQDQPGCRIHIKHTL